MSETVTRDSSGQFAPASAPRPDAEEITVTTPAPPPAPPAARMQPAATAPSAVVTASGVQLPSELSSLSPLQREAVERLLMEKSSEAATLAASLTGGTVDPNSHASGGTGIPMPAATSTSRFDFTAIDRQGRAVARQRELTRLINYLVQENGLPAPAESVRQSLLVNEELDPADPQIQKKMLAALEAAGATSRP